MGKEIQELTEGMQRLCAVANRVVQGGASRIEVDLLLENLRRLYDTALQLQTGEERGEDHAMAMVSTMAAMTQEAEAPTETPEKPEAPETPETTVTPETTETPEAPEAPVTPEAAEAPEPAMPLVEDLEDTGNALLFDEVVVEQKEPSLLDYLNRTPQRTLGESLGTSAPLQETLEKKVDDLRTVININDKFSFMSELFKGNMKAYNDFIMRLNATASRAEALAHVSDVAAQYKWDDNAPAVKTFYKIFDKKF